MKAILTEIAEATVVVPGLLYREEGLHWAIAFVVLCPIIVPVAAISYYSISKEKRELLDESESYIQRRDEDG